MPVRWTKLRKKTVTLKSHRWDARSLYSATSDRFVLLYLSKTFFFSKIAALYFILGGQGSRDYLVELKYGELLRVLPGYTNRGKKRFVCFSASSAFFSFFFFLRKIASHWIRPSFYFLPWDLSMYPTSGWSWRFTSDKYLSMLICTRTKLNFSAPDLVLLRFDFGCFATPILLLVIDL